MHGLGGIIAAVAAAFIGAGAALISAVVGAAGDADFGPWISGGGAAAAVTGLAYVVKKFASGEVVAFPVAEFARKASDREDRLIDLVEECMAREDGYRAFLIGKKATER